MKTTSISSIIFAKRPLFLQYFGLFLDTFCSFWACFASFWVHLASFKVIFAIFGPILVLFGCFLADFTSFSHPYSYLCLIFVSLVNIGLKIAHGSENYQIVSSQIFQCL